MKPGILTFNWHESYIHLLARTGYYFDVVEKWKGGRFGWIEEFRPVPPNCRLVSEDEAKAGLNAGAYARIIAHNINDLISVNEWTIPKILIFHNKLSTEIALGGNTVNREAYLENVRQLIDSTKNLILVFISKAKMEDWGMKGEIILPGVDTAEYGSWRGDAHKVLRVGNFLMERDIILGYSVQNRLLKGLPSIVLGLNPNIADSYVPKSWEEFKDFMRSHRVYLNATGHPYEDGYNLAALEAMATGMPVVSIANPSSPIEDGINGYVSSDEAYLRGRIEELLKNGSLAESLGERARETVMDKFPIESFVKEWKRILGNPIYNFKDNRHDSTKDNAEGVGGETLSMTDISKNDYFRQERRDVETLIPSGAKRILDVGCGEGILGRRLLEKGASEVVGIEISPHVCKRAEKNLAGVICADIEEIDLPFDEGYFDCVILADILEHLRAPLSTLKKLKKHLSDSGVIVASIPNVRYHGIINMLVEGHWKYEDHGILDKTHLRFFTRKEIERLFAEAGFEITGITANIDPAYNSLSDPFSGEISFGRVSLRGLTPEELKDLFVFQYLIKVQKAGVEVRRLNDAVKTAIEAENPDKAKKVLEEHLSLHPADTDVLFRYAEVCFKLGLVDKARESLEKILIFEPDREDALGLRRTIK
ncbi:MAG: methyltransferase domain-containing protein [Nitrospirota bacterium]|nr:methyltransferase domain-containing protein [Nitrospirota bacterium]